MDPSRTLLLTPWMAPHEIIPWQRAVVLVWLGKVDVLSSWDTEIASPSWSLRAPAVVRMRKPSKRASPVRFSRPSVYARDGFTCQYCGVRRAPRELSFDHVVPRARGGRTTWENIVTACRPCNDKKGARTPAEAGMTLLARPVRPHALPLALSSVPAAWEGYV